MNTGGFDVVRVLGGGVSFVAGREAAAGLMGVRVMDFVVTGEDLGDVDSLGIKVGPAIEALCLGGVVRVEDGGEL